MHPSVHHAFGLAIDASFPLDGLARAASADGRPGVSILHAEPAAIERRFPAADAQLLWKTFMDGRTVTIERGQRGDHLISYGRDAGAWISPQAEAVLCAAPEPTDAAWRRFLLDTVLFTVALLRDREALHASAVTTERGAVAFLSGQGGGKTSLAAQLVRRGHPLFCDDILALGREDGHVVAHPGPALMNVPPAAGPDRLGHVIAELDGEAWVHVEPATESPLPVAALCLLARRPGADTRLVPAAGSVIDLLPHALGLDPSPARIRSRFDVLADLAANAPILHLEADLTLSPEALADVVEEIVGDPVAALTEVAG